MIFSGLGSRTRSYWKKFAVPSKKIDIFGIGVKNYSNAQKLDVTHLMIMIKKRLVSFEKFGFGKEIFNG